MKNVYIDPCSYIFLADRLFGEDLYIWYFIKNYCRQKGIYLKTVDFWNNKNKSPDDVYVSFEHKNFLQRLYWRTKNRNYPIVDSNHFKKKILFQGEAPVATPEVYKNIDGLLKKYDEVYFSSKVDNPRCRYFHIPRKYNDIMPDLWQNRQRGFLTMINANRKPRSLGQTPTKNGGFYYKELFSERIKAIEFFSRNKEINLYGYDWEKTPFFFPQFKPAIKRVYKGTIIGGIEGKCSVMSRYNFAICFENSIAPGYISEKIFHCFYVGTIPIYLGAPDIKDYVSENCFIDMRDFGSYAELRNFLNSLTQKDIENYRENARQFLKSEKFKPFTTEYFAEKFINIVEK